jgi:hypothetical protein
MASAASAAYPSSKSNSRVVLQSSTLHPENSLHWQGLSHQPSDNFALNVGQLAELFRQDIRRPSPSPVYLALWSCIGGYCEALSTHKDETRRFSIFPVPIDAITRLVQNEFVAWINNFDLSPDRTTHRTAAKAIANAVWKRVISKPSARDELHANSLYVWLRGSIDKKAIDCFGSAVIVISALKNACYEQSYLTLSEDHAYESHPKEDGDAHPSLGECATCEVAIPGNTNAAKEKRGKEISDTFTSNVHRQSTLTPLTSWLYMAASPVVCKSIPMALAAAMGNINCHIEKKQGKSIASRDLYEIKRDLLWVLYDEGCLDGFPFALSELGDCEENLSSPRGLEWVTLDGLDDEEILVNEKLFIESILVSRKVYGNVQIYPYCYAGHYHKDAGRESTAEEYRLVEAMRLYCLAAQVASGYMYEVGDSLQLVKTLTKIAELVAEDMFSADGDDDNDNSGSSSSKSKLIPRQWTCRENAVAIGTWLLGFFDSCLLWEERSGGEDTEGKRFVEILNPSHKHGLSKLFLLLDCDVREDVISRVYSACSSSGVSSDDTEESFLNGTITETKLQYFRKPKSSRLGSKSSPLATALSKKKISIGDLELAIPGPEGGRRRKKKARAD